MSWIHFGDLHITDEKQQNFRDFVALIGAANKDFTGPHGVDFAFLPGDNADNGTAEQFQLVHGASGKLQLPLHIIPGDHDIQGGDLKLFHQWLEPALPKTVVLNGYRLVFLNSLDIEGTKGFDIGDSQRQALQKELGEAKAAGQKVVLFMHTYPSELNAAPDVGALIRENPAILLVEMGHTHYNELANDGRVIYAATRSTGQIEEGPVGFSVTCLDEGIVSWKFKELDDTRPFVMITSPCDASLITGHQHLVNGVMEVEARAWDHSDIAHATCQVGNAVPIEMRRQLGNGHHWSAACPFAAGTPCLYEIIVRVENSHGVMGEDTIKIQTGDAQTFSPPQRKPVDMENAIGAYLAKGIMGTQLGPNKNGRTW